MHRPMTALVLSVIRLFVFFVPISIVGSMLFGLKGLFVGNVIANIVMASISFVVFKRAIAQFESDNAVLNKVV
jgi:Na+-driven multidrug efflux pump